MTVMCQIGILYTFLLFILFFFSVILSISVFPDFMVPSEKGLLKYLLLYASYGLFDSSVRLGTYYVRHNLVMCLLDATRILSKTVVVGWDAFNVFNKIIEWPFQSVFIMLKTSSEKQWSLTQFGRCCVCGIEFMTSCTYLQC